MWEAACFGIGFFFFALGAVCVLHVTSWGVCLLTIGGGMMALAIVD